MTQQFVEVLNQLSKERGINKEALINTLRSAFISAAKRSFGKIIGNNAFEIRESEDGQIFAIWKKRVVETPHDFFEISLEDAKRISTKARLDQEIEVEFSPADFTRNATQTARQIIIQRIKEAERDNIYSEFKKKEGDIITGTVQRVNRNYVIIEFGKTEGILISKEQLKNENYRPGDRIKVYVVEVSKSARGPRIKLSRSHPGLVRRLFELEIPEIADKTVEIKNIAREAGRRTKIAVYAKNTNIDPVGACVGMKGLRVNSIMRELKGEKLDIVSWSDNESEFITRALGPAKISKVIINKEKKRAMVVVPNDQLSLAIGKNGQNARLSARLTNWRIDVRSEDEFKEVQRQTLSKIFKESVPKELAIDGIGKKILDKLKDAGLNTAEDIKNGGMEKLESIDGIGKKTAEKILAKVEEMLKVEDIEQSEKNEEQPNDERRTTNDEENNETL